MDLVISFVLVLLLGSLMIGGYLVAIFIATVPGGLLVTLGERWSNHHVVSPALRFVGMALVLAGWLCATLVYASLFGFVPDGGGPGPLEP